MSSFAGRTCRPIEVWPVRSNETRMGRRRGVRRMQVLGPTRCRITSPIRDRPRGILSMKHPTDTPAEPQMRFFAPELAAKYNSSNEAEADAADEEWEAALVAYANHLNTIRSTVPPDCFELTEINLHDAEILVCEEHHAGRSHRSRSVAVLSVKQNHEVVSLIYQLVGPVRESMTPGNWPFSLARPHWLYDELDLCSTQTGCLVHRVLSSDGRVREFPFESLLVQRIPLRSHPEPAEKHRAAS